MEIMEDRWDWNMAAASQAVAQNAEKGGGRMRSQRMCRDGRPVPSSMSHETSCLRKPPVVGRIDLEIRQLLQC